jgi:putative thiamine transport system substrate-binding protein
MSRPVPTTLGAAALAALLLAAPARAQDAPDPSDWDAVLEAARGQTVFWHAWGGDPRVNAFVEWAGETVEERHGVAVEHVKLADTAEAVSRVLAERAAGREEGGSVDLLWLNGENFAALKENDLLFGPFASDLPSWAFVDPENPAVTHDFTVPTEGFESPWGLAQLVFFHDAARLEAPPRSMEALLDWAAENPGRFAYPQPPDFLGTTFLKQALLELAPDPEALAVPATEAAYAAQTAPLWAWLDALTPHLWRAGRAYPANGAALRQLMADGEIDLAFSFNPGEASAAIANFELPETVRSTVLDGGTLGNASFVAIPSNASAPAGALVLADFLLSPEAQARMQDPGIWGQPTVLDLARLPEDARARFETLDLGPATLAPEALGPVLPEPHPSWVERIEEEWAARYGVGR